MLLLLLPPLLAVMMLLSVLSTSRDQMRQGLHSSSTASPSAPVVALQEILSDGRAVVGRRRPVQRDGGCGRAHQRGRRRLIWHRRLCREGCMRAPARLPNLVAGLRAAHDKSRASLLCTLITMRGYAVATPARGALLP